MLEYGFGTKRSQVQILSPRPNLSGFVKTSPDLLFRFFGQSGHKRIIPLSAATGWQLIKADRCTLASCLIPPFGQDCSSADDCSKRHSRQKILWIAIYPNIVLEYNVHGTFYSASIILDRCVPCILRNLRRLSWIKRITPIINLLWHAFCTNEHSIILVCGFMQTGPL